MIYNPYSPIANISNRPYNSYFHYYNKPLIIDDGITFPLIYDSNNLINAFFDCYSKTNKSLEMQQCLYYFSYFIFAAQNQIFNKTFVPQKPIIVIKHDPKERRIEAPRFFTRVIQKSLIQVIGQFFDALSIPNSTANVPGRGVIYAKNIVENILESSNYVLIFDIHHYFPTIDNTILRCILYDLIKCPNVYWLINKFISNAPIGIPIGSITSQYLANLYLDLLDKFIYYSLNNKRYCRYMDDFIIGVNTVEEANYAFYAIRDFLYYVLHLTLNTHVNFISSSGDFDFVGFHYNNRKVLMTERRENIVLRAIKNFEENEYGPEMYYLLLRPTVLGYIQTAYRYSDDYKTIDYIINKLRMIGIDDVSISEIKNTKAIKSIYGIKPTPFFSKELYKREIAEKTS